MKVICFEHNGTAYFTVGEIDGGILELDGVFEYHPACLEMCPPELYEEYLVSHQLGRDEAVKVLEESMDQLKELLS